MSARKLVGLFILALGLVALGPVTVAPAFGQDNGTVSAKVSAAAPCLLLSQTALVDYGTLGFNNTASQSLWTVSNCSEGSTQQLSVRGTQATSAGGTTWDLNGRNCTTPTLNRYDLRLTLSDTSLNGRFLSTTDYLVPESMPAGASWAATGDLIMPCSGSDGQGESYGFSVIFTATF